MNNLNLLLSGLLSSALLSLGLSRLAFRIDPIARQTQFNDRCAMKTCSFCTYPCFAPAPSSTAS
jgi:hypothetical protein